MKTRDHFWIIVPLLIMLCAISVVSQAPAAKPIGTGVYGDIKNGLYTNSVFRFQIQFPREWIVLENDEARELMKAGIKVAELNEKELEKKQKFRVALLSLLKKPIGSLGNATVALSAMKQPSGSVNPLDLAYIVRKSLQTSPALKFEGEPSTLRIAGKPFATFNYRAIVGDRSTTGKYFVTMSGSYSITLFISNESADDDAIVQEVINSFKFF